MPPKQKVPLDKIAWQWADSVDLSQLGLEHVRTAYRLNLTACERGSCKRNCKGNPFCLHSLGEKKWLAPVDEAKFQTFDAERVRRQKGDFVGLKNLGATCYVNTFLQLWFHNPAVRKAIYEWRSPTLPDEYYDGWQPDSICGHLQVIFALLQNSNRRFVDPSALIECLGLDAGEQQDAQEFSKLFLHVLESSLYGNALSSRNVIEEQFCGSYCYVTVCQNCGSQSETPATFYELDLNIRGHSTLSASIKDFLQEEKLEGDNQYMCSVCNSKQNASRMIRLNKLPTVLNFQLLRFVFDKTKGHKKKLSSFIQFPETLDMTPYVENSADGPAVYELAAVLIHGGPSAFSGHYIAHIREQETGAWFKFNDDDIEKVNNKKLELGREDDPIAVEGSTEKAPKASKGNHSSRYAYMLVYHRCRSTDNGEATRPVPVTEDLLPAAVRAYVEKDNKDFEDWILQMLCEQHRKRRTKHELRSSSDSPQESLKKCTRELKVAARNRTHNLWSLSQTEQNLKEVRQTHEEMKLLYSSLPVKSLDQPWEWVSADWLSKWLADPSTVEKVDNKVPWCPHNRLLPEDVIKMKCVASEGAELLFAKYPINKRYPGDTLLCDKCILQKCREIRFRNCMSDDDKLFTSPKNILSINPGEDYFWVSTKHLRSWKKFAIGEIAVQSMSEETFSSSNCGSSTSVLLSSVASDDHCPVSYSTENMNHIRCDNWENDCKTHEYLTGKDSSSATSPPSQRSSILTLLPSHYPYRIHDIKNTVCPSLDTNSTETFSEQSGTMRHIHANATSKYGRGSPEEQSSPGKTSPTFNGRGHHSSGEGPMCDRTCESPDSGTIVLKRTMDAYGDTIYDISQDRLSPECSASDTTDSNKCLAETISSVFIGQSDTILDRNGTQDGCGEEERKEQGASCDAGNGDDDKEEKMEQGASCDAGNGDDDKEEKMEQGASCDAGNGDDDKEEKFNDDILCEHGNLRIDGSGRRLVSKLVWERLLYYFPHLQAFNKNSPVCESCLVDQYQQQQLKESRKLAGQGQKDVLQNLYHGKNRPKIGDNWEGRTAFIVSSNFVEGWRKFVKHSMKSESVQEIVNAPLLCEHNLLLYKPEDMNSPDNATRFTLVWKEEWDKLIGYFEYDVEIRVVQLTDGDSGQMKVVTVPGVCSTCLNERIRQEEEGKFIFTRQIVYIRKIVDGTGVEQKTDEPKENGKGYNYDPEFSAPLQQRLNKARGACPPPEKQPKLDPVGIRKSSRHRKTRGEKEVLVSSSMTLKELKIQLFSVCDVPPFDQNLSLDGRSLKNDEATLQDLKVYPNCVIFLKADEPTGGVTSSVDDYLNVPTRPEEGFKGTNLLGR